MGARSDFGCEPEMTDIVLVDTPQWGECGESRSSLNVPTVQRPCRLDRDGLNGVTRTRHRFQRDRQQDSDSDRFPSVLR